MRNNQRTQAAVPPSSAPSGSRPVSSSAQPVLLPAAEIFVGRANHTPEETRVFLELARNLLPLTPVEHRRRIAHLIAGHPALPDDLNEQLARDEDPLTAAQALCNSPRLSVDLLLSVAEAGPEVCRLAVARRPSLRESVLSALCDHAEANVIQRLMDRDDVKLTKTHQAKLSRRSDIIAALGLELAGQDALHPEGLMGQFLHLPAPLRKQAIAAAELTSLVKQAQTQGGPMSQRTEPNRLRIQDALVADALTQDRPRFAERLAQGLGLSRATCNILMRSDQGEGLIIALKALGMPECKTSTILIRLLGEDKPLMDIRGLLRMHRTLSNGAAEALVSQWMLHDQAPQTAQPRHSSQYQEAKGRKGTAQPSFAERGKELRQTRRRSGSAEG